MKMAVGTPQTPSYSPSWEINRYFVSAVLGLLARSSGWVPGPEGERLCLQGLAFLHSPFLEGTALVHFLDGISASPGGLCTSQSSAVGGTVLGKRKQWAGLGGLTGAEAGRDLLVPL